MLNSCFTQRWYVVRSVLSAVLNMHTQPASAVIVLHIPVLLVWQNTLSENLILHIFNLVWSVPGITTVVLLLGQSFLFILIFELCACMCICTQ